MSSIAILVGNSTYSNLTALNCCRDDIQAMRQLLQATDNYADIHVVENVGADDLKSQLRSAIDCGRPLNEIFFYFSGHGVQSENEFFFCASNFDQRHPNETGLSVSELHALLRLGNAELVVKVVDACNSGTLLVKDGAGFAPQEKHGFTNLVQISSCLDTQNSLTGDPLSEFTDKFIKSALRKTDGTIYYIDIISSLRDAYIDNNSQTPHFVFQVTGREKFVDDAAKLASFRGSFFSAPQLGVDDGENADSDTNGQKSLLQILEEAESKVANQTAVREFVSKLFDGLIATLSTDQFSDFFSMSIEEHSNYVEPTTRGFIIRVLSKETRPDNFVTATITREAKKRDPLGIGMALRMSAFFGGDDEYVETHSLKLNCSMDRAQIKVTLTPKYSALQRLVLVVTCAPSLEHCYVFELSSQHPLVDFGEYSEAGTEVVRRWYKIQWTESTESVIRKISGKLIEVVKEHLEAAEKRLAKE